jgi:transposase InsO family protein
MDKQYTRTPFYGIKCMTAWLGTQGYAVNHKRVARPMHLMGLEAIYPKPRLSQPGATLQKYPYLLRGLTIARVNQAWSTDISYSRLAGGFLYARGDLGLVQPVRARLVVVDYLGHELLPGSAGGGFSRGSPCHL